MVPGGCVLGRHESTSGLAGMMASNMLSRYLLLLVLPLALLAAGCGEPGPTNTPQRKLEARIFEWVDIGGTYLSITNENDFPWYGAKVTVNGQYKNI